MSEFVKFSSKLDPGVADGLRQYAQESGRTVAGVLNEAVAEYLQRAPVRPAFRTAVDEVIDEHDELLQRLAR